MRLTVVLLRSIVLVSSNYCGVSAMRRFVRELGEINGLRTKESLFLRQIPFSSPTQSATESQLLESIP
jgi:hypothetical protein